VRRWGTLLVAVASSAACGSSFSSSSATTANVDDGSVALVKDVSGDCTQRLVDRPKTCVWSSPDGNTKERDVVVRLEIASDGVPVHAENADPNDRAGTACAMALRYAGGGQALCTVRLRLARYVQRRRWTEPEVEFD
jgi:hypothetical protein